MEKLLRYILLVVLIVHPSAQQHIFDETCTFAIANSTETFTFASQLWHIENKFYDVYINFCKGLSGIPTCDANALACIAKKKGTKKFVPSAAAKFTATIEKERDGTNVYLLTANTTTATCSDGPYEFKIILDKTIISNKISHSDECSMEITIPHPSVEIRDCGFAYKGFNMDMKPLQMASEQLIAGNDVRVAIAACRPAPSCERINSTVSSICEISPNGNVFSVAESQHIVYDERSNVLTLRGRQPTIQQRRDKIKSEVRIDCNWTATFDHPVKQAGKYKYVIESKYGCVKMPLTCQLEDMEYYVYDLSVLNKPTGWRVGNITLGTALINVCGTLTLKPNTGCSETYSQVCYQNGNKYLSYGGLNHGLTFDADNIRLDYTHGSQCTYGPFGNITTYATSHITFVCARNDYGPIVTSNVNCSMHIEWKTPKACPTHVADEATFSYKNIKQQIARVQDLPCSVHDDNGQLYDLGTLIPKTPLVFVGKLPAAITYYINICRPIPVTADNYLCKVTGACLEDTNEVNIKKRFVWVGSVGNPRFENRELVIRYNGGFCANSTSGVREVVIHFICSKTMGTMKLSKESNCRTDFQWDTPLACDKKRKRSIDCVLRSSGGKVFDFNRIQNQNFQITFANVSYNFDVCQNVVVQNLTTKEENISVSRQLLYNSTTCQYSLIYVLGSNLNSTSTCTSATSLNSLRVDLVCDEIVNNIDHFGNYSLISACDAAISIQTNTVCAQLLNECKQHQNEVKVEVQQDEGGKTWQSCKVTQDNQEFPIQSMNEIHFNDGKNNYSINANNGKCTGFVCMNDIALATLDMCPNVDVVQEKSMVELNLIGGPICQNDHYKVKIQIRCSAQPHAKISLSSECATHFIVDSNQTSLCALFAQQMHLQDKPKDISVTGLIIGIVVLCLAIILIVFIAWKRFGLNRCLPGSQHELIPNKFYERDVDD